MVDMKEVFKALRTAIRSEKSAQRMYEKLSAEATNPEVQSLFKHLAQYELTHQQFLEAEMRALQASNGDPDGMPSHWLEIIDEELELKLDNSENMDLQQLRISLYAAENLSRILKSANDELLKKQVRYENELAIAADIQKKLLPQKLPDYGDLQISATNIMAAYVGGDYYDFLEDEQGQLAIVVGDSMGKGIPAALLMLTVRAVWRAWSISGFESPGETLEIINESVYPDLSTIESFVTMFNALYDPETSIFRYSNAGHNPPLLRTKNASQCQKLEIGGLPIGMFPNTEYHSGKIKLKKGDVVVIYTDGVVETRDSKDNEFGINRLCNVIDNHYNDNADDIVKAILKNMELHTGNSNWSDDVTIVVLKKL